MISGDLSLQCLRKFRLFIATNVIINDSIQVKRSNRLFRFQFRTNCNCKVQFGASCCHKLNDHYRSICYMQFVRRHSLQPPSGLAWHGLGKAPTVNYQWIRSSAYIRSYPNPTHAYTHRLVQFIIPLPIDCNIINCESGMLI